MAKQHAPAFLKLVTDAKSRVTECTVADVLARKSAGEPFVIVDVREESEFAAGHIPGAVHIGKGVIERDIEAKVPDSQTPLVLYCGGGFRSALAADALQKMGYTNVISMDGGWRAWTQQGLPVEKS
jgi:rhodanese-related sulfurtransferase